jgi:hypothetical protein
MSNYKITFRKRKRLEVQYLNRDPTPRHKDPFKNIVFKIITEDYKSISRDTNISDYEEPYVKYMRKDSIDSMDSSLSELNDYQRNRIKNKICNENTLIGQRRHMNKDNDTGLTSSVNKKMNINLKKCVLPASLKNMKENLNNEERKKYNELFNKINFSNKPSVRKGSLSLSEKVRLLYK